MGLAGIAVVVAVAFFVIAPIIYSPTVVYGPLVYYSEVNPPKYQYPNWESLSCWAFGFGMYYGRTVSWVTVSNGSGESAGALTAQYGNATQFGCPPSTTALR